MTTLTNNKRLRLPHGQAQAEAIIYQHKLNTWAKRMALTRPLEGKSMAFFDAAFPPVTSNHR